MAERDLASIGLHYGESKKTPLALEKLERNHLPEEGGKKY
jgi:hypothetical protein